MLGRAFILNKVSGVTQRQQMTHFEDKIRKD